MYQSMTIVLVGFAPSPYKLSLSENKEEGLVFITLGGNDCTLKLIFLSEIKLGLSILGKVETSIADNVSCLLI